MSSKVPEAVLSLNFFVYGETKHDLDRARVSSNAEIADLIDEVQKAYAKRKGYIILIDKIFKLDILQDELPDLQLPEDDLCLSRIDLISDHWPHNLERVRGKVHILIKPYSLEKVTWQTSRSQDIVSSSGTPKNDIDKKFAELTAKQNNNRNTINKGPTPSTAAQASELHYRQRRHDTPIYNGRPRDKQGLPLELYHPAFHAFTAHTQSTTIPDPADLRAMELLLSCAQNTYLLESDRVSALRDYLESLLDTVLTIDNANGCKASGVVMTKSGVAIEKRKAYVLIMEVKNEIGTGDSDPSTHCAQSYARYWSNSTLNCMRDISCCPSFLLAIAGPWICILGAVYVEHVIVHPLTDFMWMGRQPREMDRLCRLTRKFCALRKGISHLVEYYETLPRQREPTMGRFFPYIDRFCDLDGHEILFDYFEVLATSPVRPVFRAKTRNDSGDLIVIKFVRDYNSAAHRLLATKGLAPKLIHDSVHPLPCGLRMVVMEYVKAPSLYDYLNKRSKADDGPDIQAVRTDVESALALLHAEDYVFGDLRKPNVLVVKKESGMGGMLIDFDWCSAHGEGRYPLSLNDLNNVWAKGVTRGGLMDKKHDEDMLLKLFEPDE